MGHPVSSRQGDLLGEGFLPHFVGGHDIVKSLLLSPYPAIPPYVVRTLHPGMTDDRARMTSGAITKQLCIIPRKWRAFDEMLLHNCRRTAAGLPRSCCTAAVELCSSCLSVSDDHGGGDMDQFNHVRALLGQKKTPRKVETHKVCQASNRLPSFMELPKVDRVHQVVQNLPQSIKLIKLYEVYQCL